MISFGKIPLLILPALAVWHSAALWADDEDMTTGTAPPPLVMEPPQTTAPGLMRWLGDPLRHTANISEFFWSNDGSHLYLQADYGARRQVWKGESGGSELKLIGFLPLYPKMAASPDGRWIAGQGKFNTNQTGLAWTLGLFHADTLQGVWEIQNRKELLNIDEMMFSWDGKYLVIGELLNGGYSLSILDAETGHRVKHIERRWPEDASGAGPFFPPGRPNGDPRHERPQLAPGKVCFCMEKDSVLLSSVFDDQNRLTRVSLKTFESTPVGAPVQDQWRFGGFLPSGNGEWLAFVNNSEYSVRRWNGEDYVEIFNGRVSDEASDRARFNDHDNCVYFSPDNAYFVITAAGRYKVIWLQNRQVVHESETESLKGFYTPDGRTFWQTEPQFRALDTGKWEPRPEAAPWASHDVKTLHFNPKGHQVLFGNEYAAEVWDIQGTQPLAELAPPKSPILASFLWNASGREVYGSDLDQYLHWKMPGTLKPGKTERIVGETLFEVPARYQNTKREWVNEDGWRFTRRPVLVAVDEATDTCLTAMHPFRDSADFRYPDRPLVMHHMDLGDKNPSPLEHGFFGPGGKELYYSSDAAWITSPNGNGWQRGQELKLFAYDMETDHLRHSPVRSHWGELVGYDKVHGRLIMMGRTDGIVVLDASTANPLKRLSFFRSQAQWMPPAAVSPDGRWFVCMLYEFMMGVPSHKIVLVDLDKGSLAALIPEPLSQVQSADFSADNAYLALGHQNGCVSLWNMTALPQESAVPKDFRLVDRMTMGPRSQMSETGPAVHVPPKMGVVPPIRLKQGGTWLIDEKGSLNVDRFDVKIGDWVVNGFPTHAHGQTISSFSGPEAAYVDVSTELRDASGNLRVQRHAHVDTRGQISFVDEWENLSDTPQDPRVDFVAALGVELTAMLCENGAPPEIKARKLVFGGNENHLAALLPPSADQPEQALGICFGGVSAPQHPLFRWSPRERSLVSEWTLHLAPFQRRVICHEVLQHPGQDPQSMPALFAEYRAHGFESHVPESLVDHVVNFAIEPQYRNAFEKLNQSKGLETDGSRKDVLGFHWRHTESIDDAESELGVERILPLWLNRQPLSFSRASNDTAKNDVPGADQIEEFTSPDTPLQVQRRTFFSPEDGCLVTHDTFVNNTDKTVAVPADYLIVARSQIASVIGADGNKLDLSEPFPVKNCQGRLAVIFAGDSKPALVLAAGDPQAALLPVLLYFPDSALFLHYDIKLDPGERVSLANLAAPRSLSALDKPVDAFANLKSPMGFSRFQMKGIAAAANWMVGAK